jgi:hypothetical protein
VILRDLAVSFAKNSMTKATDCLDGGAALPAITRNSLRQIPQYEVACPHIRLFLAAQDADATLRAWQQD